MKPAIHAAEDDILPDGWTRARLGELVLPVPNIRPEDEPDRVFGYVDISAIDNTHNVIRDAEIRRFSGADAPSRARRPIKPGDVLFSNVRTNLRNVAMVGPGAAADVCSTGFTVLRSNGAIAPGYLFYSILTDSFVDTVSEQQTGTHYPAVSDRVILAQTIPLPPLAEQRRVVDELEVLLAEARIVRERLARVPLILKRFRQSVLEAAYSGRLTESWRQESATREPRIAHESMSRVRLDEDIEQRLDDGIKLDDLPESWQWIRFGEVVAESLYGPRFGADSYTDDGIPTVRTTDISSWGRINLKDPPRIKLGPRQIEQFALRPGDILVTRTGATIGKCALYEESLGPALPSAYLIRFRLRHEMVLPRCALLYLLSPTGQRLLGIGSTSVAQPNINARTIASFPFPLVPLEEQHEIVRRVDALFALAEAVEKRLATAIARAEKVPQAIFAKAFRGELVPTEAELARQEGRDYEPAAALLERIRREREAPAPRRRTARAR